MGYRKVSGADGVDIRESSIRLVFTWNGKQRKETLRDDEGRSMPPSAANVKFAKRLASEINSKIRLGVFDFSEAFPFSKSAKKTAPKTFGEFVDKWYGQLKLKKATMTTYRRYKDSFFKPQLGHLPVKSIKHSDITLALAKGNWTSNKTRNNVLSIARSIFALAMVDGLITKDPTAAIENLDWQKPRPDPFEPEEMERIIAYMNKHYPEQAANFFQFRFYTGLRTSEAIGLEWCDVDFKKMTLHVRRGFVVDEMEQSTKTSTERVVDLTGEAIEVLLEQKKWTFLGGDRVFHDPGTNKPWAYEQNARKRYWMPALKALGIRYRRPYNTRSTFATIGLMADVNPAYMAEQLGHAIEVFFNDYTKWIHGKANRVEVAKISKAILASKSEEDERARRI